MKLPSMAAAGTVLAAAHLWAVHAERVMRKAAEAGYVAPGRVFEGAVFWASCKLLRGEA